MHKSLLSLVLGAALILTGMLVSSPTLVASLRATPVHSVDRLLPGATLFRIGLVVLGLVVIALGIMPMRQSGIQSDRPVARKPDKVSPAILVALLFAASALRLYQLNSGLWFDEIVTYVLYGTMPIGEIITTYDSQNQHFLYTLLARLCMSIFGESGWALRLPAVLFGIGTVYALYLLGRQVGPAREALLAAALLTFSYHHIWFSQNARGYIGLLFWTILASWLFMRGLDSGQPRYWLPYAAVAALGIFTHMTMLFVVVGHFIVYMITLFTRRKEIWHGRWRGLYLGFCVGGLLTFQLHALILPQLFGGTMWQGAESTVAAWKNPLWTLLEFMKGIEIGFATGAAALALFSVFGTGLLSFIRTKPVFAQLCVFPVLVTTVALLGMGHPLWPRVFFFAIGFAALIIVRGTMEVSNVASRLLYWSPARSALIGTVLCSGLIIVSASSIPHVYGPKQDFLGALAYVRETAEPDDAIATVGVATYAYKDLYRIGWRSVETVADLHSLRSRSKRTWLLYTLPLHMDSVYPEIMATVRRDFHVVKEFHGTLGGGAITICRSDLPSS